MGSPLFTKPNPDATECVPICSPGQFSFGNDQCQPCPPGKFSTIGSVLFCSDCPENMFSGPGSKQCTPCPSGTTAPQVRFFTCLLYTREHPPMLLNLQGSPTCFPICGPGQFLNGLQCQFCPPGTSSPPNSKICIPCQPGTFAPTFGTPSCLPCPSGTFSLSVRSV